ncbi:unnamed protein product [Brassica rapa subsp. trilocularis]
MAVKVWPPLMLFACWSAPSSGPGCIEDSGSGHAFPAARVVGGCVAPVLLAAYDVLSSLSFN